MKLFQYSCIEGQSVDSRQANAVLKKRPDVIIFEAPIGAGRLTRTSFSMLTPQKISQGMLETKIDDLKRASARYPWIASDIAVYRNVSTLWKQGFDVNVYAVDAPSELLRETLKYRWNTKPHPHRRGTHFEWWMYIYLRERIMAHNIEILLNRYEIREVGLVFLQKFHWLNVQFLLSHPSQSRVFRYYFGAFRDISIKNINERVENLKNPILHKYWKKVGGLTLH